jgi:hypothetical protein
MLVLRAGTWLGTLAIVVGCRRDAALSVPTISGTVTPTGSAPSSSAPSPSASTPLAPNVASAGAPTPTRVVRVTLVRWPVEVALPGGWEMVARLSDEAQGLVAFSPTEYSERAASAFLDGTPTVRVPASSAQADSEILDLPECPKPSVCPVLTTEALPGGGFLVSARTPQAVVVRSWRAAPSGRAVRCGFEVSAIGTLPGPKWLNDPDAVARARIRGEEFCRSVKPVP